MGCPFTAHERSRRAVSSAAGGADGRRAVISIRTMRRWTSTSMRLTDPSSVNLRSSRCVCRKDSQAIAPTPRLPRSLPAVSQSCPRIEEPVREIKIASAHGAPRHRSNSGGRGRGVALTVVALDPPQPSSLPCAVSTCSVTFNGRGGGHGWCRPGGSESITLYGADRRR